MKGEKEKTDEVEVLKRQMANLKQALIDMQRIISHLSDESDKGGDKGWKNGKPLRG